MHIAARHEGYADILGGDGIVLAADGRSGRIANDVDMVSRSPFGKISSRRSADREVSSLRKRMPAAQRFG
jgi:hypothetical protein